MPAPSYHQPSILSASTRTTIVFSWSPNRAVRGQVEVDGIIAAPIVRDDRSVEPDRRIGRDGAELQLEIFAAILGIEPQRAPIPGIAARAISLRGVGLPLERHLDCPVVRQIDVAPVRIVEIRRRRALCLPRLRIGVAPAMALDDGEGDVALVELPGAIEQQPAGLIGLGAMGSGIARRGHGQAGHRLGRGACGSRRGRSAAARQRSPRRQGNAGASWTLYCKHGHSFSSWPNIVGRIRRWRSGPLPTINSSSAIAPVSQ